MEREKNVEEVIKTTITELIEKMGFEGTVEVLQEKEGERETLVCNIKTNESNFLIGQYGVNLQSLQHMARLLLKKKLEDKVDFILDVNSYRQEKNLSLVKLANEMAEQAINEKRAVVMRPMSPYERRIIHLELLKNDEVKTESIGEGEDRKIVIKPVNLV